MDWVAHRIPLASWIDSDSWSDLGSQFSFLPKVYFAWRSHLETLPRAHRVPAVDCDFNFGEVADHASLCDDRGCGNQYCQSDL